MRKKIVLTTAVWTAVTFSFLFFFFGRSSAKSEPKNYSIESMSTSIQHASISAAHYSSGGGGGFSGGGGGGGGGGGSSAG